MKKASEILTEAGFRQLSATCRFRYDKENSSLGAEKLAEIVRAVPGATRVSTVSLDRQNGIAIYTVRLITSKDPTEAFKLFKRNILDRFGKWIKSVEIGQGTIEVKDAFITVSENLNNLKNKIIKEYNLQ